MNFTISEIKNYTKRNKVFENWFHGTMMIFCGIFFPIFFNFFINSFDVAITNAVNSLNQSVGITTDLSFKKFDGLEELNHYFLNIWSTWMILVGCAYIMKSFFYKAKNNEGEEIIENKIISQEIIEKNIDFKNEDLNTLFVEINDLAIRLLNNKLVKENPEWNFLINKSKKEYILNIYEIYTNLPNNEKNIIETKKQLLIVLHGLKKIEKEIQNQLYENQKINTKFLEEKIKAIGE